MNTVHGRRNEEDPIDILKPGGHLEAAMMKLGSSDDQDFINGNAE